MNLTAGVVLRGKYRLEASIGRGGMGEVFEATVLSSGLRVAVKVVSRAVVDETLMARLQREAVAARRIRSEFVPRLYDVDSTEDGELFLVMERLFGETLADRLARREREHRPLGWEEVCAIGDDVLRGLVDAHAAGVIHRDLKPGNIFIEQLPGGFERARVLDFGVCKLDAHDEDSLTATGEAVGTIAYMAPEQIRGASRVDERADLYSFAMVVFEALSGRLAHQAPGQIALIASKLERPARHLRECARVPVPPALGDLVARCLSRKAVDRVGSAATMLVAWRSLGSASLTPTPPSAFPLPGHSGAYPSGAYPSGAYPSGGYPSITRLTSATVSSPELRRSSRAGLLVAAATLVLSLAVLVVALRLRGGANGEAPAAAPPALTPPSTYLGAAAAPTLAPVVLDDEPEPPRPPAAKDAGAPKRDRRPAASPRSSSPKAPPPPRGPQIAVEPRY